MNSRTAAALNRINRDFYTRFAQDFAATRSHPWPGWNRALAPFFDQVCRRPAESAGSILDLGCGNGRFAVFLGGHAGVAVRYLGVDASCALIESARRRVESLAGIKGSFRCVDLVEDEIPVDLEGRPFDLVVLFGVLHHIPGFQARRELLERSVLTLAAGGFLIVSFWQFGREPRFQRRLLDWHAHNETGSEPIEVNELEKGDLLLAWGDREETARAMGDPLGARRYCHHVDPREAQRLLQGLGARVIDRFQSDGRSDDLNLYCVLQAPG